MTQPLPITPSALTKRARSILGIVGASSRKVAHMTDVVDVFVGDVVHPPAPEVLATRRVTLVDELTRQGYLAEPIGHAIVRVRRPEDVERKRQEMQAAGAADAARLSDIVPVQEFRGMGQQTVHWPEDTLDRIAASTGGTARRLHAVYGVDRVTGEAVCTCGVHLPEADIDRHVTTGNAYEPDIAAQDAQDDRVRAASDPDAAPTGEHFAQADAAMTSGVFYEVSGGGVTDDQLRDALARLIAAVGQRSYVSGWNDGHLAGISEADDVLLTARSSLAKAREYTFDTDPNAED